jgi:hypothetical protein
MTVYALGTRKNNADLMVDCRTLGYLSDEMVILDPTYGEGKFWKKWMPPLLIASDLYVPAPGVVDWDFTAMPVGDAAYDAVVFDPPYQLNGTSTGRGPSAKDEGYGVHGEYRSWQAKHSLIRAGITEAVRVTKPKGMVLVKCMDQVCSGQKRWQTHEFTRHAESLGCRLVDMMHVGGTSKQPAGRSQVHAQGDFSTLLIFRKARHATP